MLQEIGLNKKQICNCFNNKPKTHNDLLECGIPPRLAISRGVDIINYVSDYGDNAKERLYSVRIAVALELKVSPFFLLPNAIIEEFLQLESAQITENEILEVLSKNNLYDDWYAYRKRLMRALTT